MNLLDEYKKQQTWRQWERYLQEIPYKKDDIVLDLGCSVGGMSHLFAQQVKQVIGVDLDSEFIDFCRDHQSKNELFICEDIQKLELNALGNINGVWASFSLSYLENPLEFLQRLYASLPENAWISVLDISCFISGNLAQDSVYHQRVREFEMASHRSGIYDFAFASRMAELLEAAGFTLIYSDFNVSDPELNFDGAASQELLQAWSARLQRMVRLQEHLKEDYPRFCEELILSLQSPAHERRNNVGFVVANKR